MIIKFKRLTVILFIAVLLGSSQITIFAQTSTNDLLQRRIQTDFSNACFLEVLSRLAVDYQVPIGLELATDYDETVQNSMYLENGSIKWKPCEINIAAGTLQNVLTAFIQQNPYYKWEIIDNVINVSPVKLQDDSIKELLNTQVSHFRLFLGDGKFKIRDSILDLPEIQAAIDRAKIKSLKRAYSYKQSNAAPLAEIRNFEKISLRRILNASIELTEHKMWTIKKTGENKDNLVLMF